MRWLSISLLVVSAVIPAKAQQPIKWECTITTAASYGGGNEKDRDPSRFEVAPQQLALTFLVEGMEGFVMGKNGAEEVALVATDSGGLQFIERVGSGALQITAIDINGNAVHSRHTVGFDGMLLGAQHYGKCRQL
jgi:hypothetical protein